jgi:DNA-3-methyladenine glycosylase
MERYHKAIAQPILLWLNPNSFRHIYAGYRKLLLMSSHRIVKVPMKLSDQTRHETRLRRLRRAELPVDTVELAQYLIGKVVVHDIRSGRLSGRIVETEAYPLGDAAGHAFRGETRRNRSLFLKRGHAYVYFSYGSHFLLNVTSEAAGMGAGVLLRAIEPLEDLNEFMTDSCGAMRIADIGRGPGRLTRALQVDLRQNGLDLCAASSPLWLAAITRTPQRSNIIRKSIRIGITRAADRLLRFYEIGNPHVSGPKNLRQ